MNVLKRTRENDRIHANLMLHKKFMDDLIAGGEAAVNASRLALVRLQQMPMSQRIKQANEMRSAKQ